MLKAMHDKVPQPLVEETGLGLSDFGVLEVLLNKGPARQYDQLDRRFDPGSISITVDLTAKGL
jgi:hypothetical protein